MAKIFNRALLIGGEQKIVGTPSIVVLEYNISSHVSRAQGASVPTDGDAGYAKGCVFVKTGGGVGTTFYINEGSASSADFNVSAGGATGDITAVTAGNGLTGGGSSGDVTLNIANTDGKITVGANSIDITASSLVNADISATAAIAFSKLAALSSANILVGNGSNVAVSVAMSGDAAISNAGVVTVSDLTITSEAQGDIIYFNGSNWVRLGAGTNGQFLKTQGAGSNLVWDNAVVGTASALSSPFTIEGGTYDPSTTVTAQTSSAAALTIPDLAGVAQQWVFSAVAQTLLNKSLSDSTTYVIDNSDGTKKLQFQCSGITTGTTRTLTIPDVSGTIALVSDKLSAFAATTSAELAGVISDETGSGLLVFATSPVLTTPNIGVATATSVNKITITAPATGATLTLAEGSSLVTSGANSITLTSTGATNVTLPTTGTLITLAGSEILTNKTLTTPVLTTPDVNGIIVAYVSKSGAYTATATDEVIDCDGTGGAFSITLPTAVGIAGTRYTIRKSDGGGNAITIDGSGAETINGSATVALSAQYNYRTIVSDGTNWIVVASG